MNTTLTGHHWERERAWLGYAGLLPFLTALAVLVFAADGKLQQLASDLLRYYAAVIASFLGAVHWGVAADHPRQRAHLRWGVMPALLAWLLLPLPAGPAFAGFALLFVLILGVDRQLLPILDDRYRALRLQLSAVVIGVMLAAWLVAGHGT